MTSAFDGDDSDGASPGNEENMYPTSDWVKFALDLPISHTRKPGVDWAYFTAGAMLVGDILHRSVPGGLEHYADQRLMKPLGISRYQWQYTPQKVVSTAGGLKVRALDLAKFGQLYANHGEWNGVQLLPREWVQTSLTSHANRPDGGHYGYLFWNTEWTIDGQHFEAFNSSGNGGNKIYVFTTHPLVVVITATAYNQPYAHAQVEKLMQQLVLPAVTAASAMR
jgi:CubicO group peptidase (beta-lactamase class C family)